MNSPIYSKLDTQYKENSDIYNILCLSIAAVIFSESLLSVWMPPIVPLQDMNEWIYQGGILASILRGAPIHSVIIANYPVPNSLMQLILGLLSLALRPIAAGRVLITSYIVFGTWVGGALARRYHPRHVGPITLVYLISMVLNSPFWNGYLNSQIGLIIFLSYFLLSEEWRAKQAIVMGEGIVLFFTHAISFAAFALYIVVRATLYREQRNLIIAIVPPIVLFFWYISMRAPVELAAIHWGGALHFLSYKVYTCSKLGGYHNFIFSSGGDAIQRPWVYRLGIASNLAYLAGILGMLVSIAFNRSWREIAAEPALVAAAIAVAIALCLPQNMADVVNPGERLIYLAFGLALPFIQPKAWLVRAMAAAAVMLAVSVIPLLDGNQEKFRTAVSDEILHGGDIAQALYLHRPTAFVQRVEGVGQSEYRTTEPRLFFETSFLLQRR